MIDQDIREAVSKAKKQWQETPRDEQLLLFPDSKRQKIQQQSLFDVSGVTDDEFWADAESKLVAALNDYATFASNGKSFPRRLFANDAIQGFAFLDVCRNTFDVVLMNPPFGEPIPAIRPLLADYFTRSSVDIGMAFVDRGVRLLADKGKVGAITTRTFIANDSLEDWRIGCLLGGDGALEVLADLGIGVLDEALVEAAAYVVAQRSSDTGSAWFIRLLDERQKEEALDSFLRKSNLSASFRATVHLRDLSAFNTVPGHTLCYWVPATILTRILGKSTLKSRGGLAREGLIPGDDFRFVRAIWEVGPGNVGRGKHWVPYPKGGEYEPFYDDIHLVVDWENDGEAIRNFVDSDGNLRSRPQGLKFFYRPGITYPERTTSDFSPRILPENSIFSRSGRGIFLKDREEDLRYLAGSYTRIFKLLVEALVGSGDSSVSGSAAKHYRSGMIEDLPHPLPDAPPALMRGIRQTVEFCYTKFDNDETSRTFKFPPVLIYDSKAGLRIATAKRTSDSLERKCEMLAISKSVDDYTSRTVFQLSEKELSHLQSFVGPHPCGYTSERIEEKDILDLWQKSESEIIAAGVKKYGARRQITKKSYFIDRRLELISHISERHPNLVASTVCRAGVNNPEDLRETARELLSYCIGCIFGRWDIRLAVEKLATPKSPELFSPVPVCSPGMLIGENGLPASNTPHEYPLDIAWDGIIVDDPAHSFDINRCVRLVFDLLFDESAEAIEKEVCEILGFDKLGQYFSDPRGFFNNHIKQYSKSRRRAPIYWLFQSSRRSFGAWIYYNRLDMDLIFKVLVNYVEPKIRLEASRLEVLRVQLAAGTSDKETKRLAKETEQQEDFISEMRDFEDKLRRATNLHLVPDLNDGVVLNIAPLHEFVPWPEATNYWEELLEGKYEWSSIGKQLRQKGLVK